MGNFNWRLETSLNYLGNNLRKLGKLDDVEVVVTDWGSECPLHRVLALNSAARRIVRYVLVPAALARQLQGDSEFPIVLAQNTAVQRSRGEYIAQTDSDILFPIEFLERLFAILDEGVAQDVPVDAALVVCKRLHIPWVCLDRQPSLTQLDWLVHHLRFFLYEYPISAIPFQATAFFMMHRSIWEEGGGYDERLIHWGGMEDDLGFRVTRKYPCLSLKEFGVTLFHLEHYHPSTGRQTTRKINQVEPNNIYHPNDEDWGLSRYVLQEFTHSVSPQEIQPANTDDNQRIRVNFKLTIIIMVVVLAGFRAVKQGFAYLLLFVSTWCHRARFVWRGVRGHPVRHWPWILRHILAEWQYRRKSVELERQK